MMFGLNKILTGYDSFIFISPHLDDAVLSCGHLITELIKNRRNVTIVTIFTKGLKKTITPQAKDFLKSCGYTDPQNLFRDRLIEDVNVQHFLKTKGIYFKFIDAAWRLNNRIEPIYKTPQVQFAGKIAKDDSVLINHLKIKLSAFYHSDSKTLILGSLGVGGHTDHVIVREVLKSLPGPKLFWEDFPYNTNKKSLNKFFEDKQGFKPFLKIFRFRFSDKNRAIKFYRSQIKLLFPTGKIPNITERYYSLKNSRP